MSLVILSMGALGVGGDPTAPPQAPPAPALPPPPIVTPPSPCPTITITPGTVPNGTAGVPYRQSFVASGGTGPYTFTSTGVIPPGLTLASTGVLSGTPTVPATLTVAIIATDANGCFGNVVGPILISPAPPPPCPTIVVGPTSLPFGTVGTPYSQALTATGGTAPYTFTAGPLPAGVTLSPSGALSGTPTVATSIYVTLTATDTHGCPGTLVIPMTIQPTPPPIVPTPPPSQPPGSQRILGAADIAYVGCFRLPATISTSFAYGNLTGRVVNGKVNLFVYGNNPTLHDPVFEITDPGSGYTSNFNTAPRATLYANWGNIYGGKRISFNASTGAPITPGFLIPAGLFWNDATQLLYWTYYDGYNVSGRPDWGLGASQLIDPVAGTSFASGPWRTKATDADGAIHYGPWRCLYLWQSPLDGSFLCGSSIQSGNVGSPWGPDMYGMSAWPIATTPPGPSTASDLVLTTRSLEHYFMGNSLGANYLNADGSVHGHLRSARRTLEPALYEPFAGVQPLRVNPALNGGVGSWSELDGTGGAIWLQLTHVRGVIFSSVLAGAVSQVTTDPLAAHEWYSNKGVGRLNCSHGIPPPVGVTGPVTTAAFPAFLIYNPDDLAAVANTANDYTPEPTSVIDLVATYGVQVAPITTLGAAKSLAGFYFDPIRKYLFMIARQVDNSRGPYTVESLIHVFAVNDVP